MIRRAVAKDAEKILELLIQVCNVHAKGRPDLFIAGKTKYTAEDLKDMFLNDRDPIFVWTNDRDEVCGYAFCQTHEIEGENNRPDRRTLYIDDLCVDENCRRMHIGESLYRYVLSFARDHGYDSVQLNVWELNGSARAFYEKMGLKPLKTTMETIL